MPRRLSKIWFKLFNSRSLDSVVDQSFVGQLFVDQSLSIRLYISAWRCRNALAKLWFIDSNFLAR